MKLKCLYTKHITQKKKVFLDGTLLLKGKTLELRSAEGNVVSTCRETAGLQLSPEYDENLTCFEGFLVQIDGELLEDDSSTVPQQQQPTHQQQAAPQAHPKVTSFKHSARPALTSLQPQQANAVPAKRPSSTFLAPWKPPRRLAPSPTTQELTSNTTLGHLNSLTAAPETEDILPWGSALTAQPSGPGLDQHWCSDPHANPICKSSLRSHTLAPDATPWGVPEPRTLGRDQPPHAMQLAAPAKQGWGAPSQPPSQPVNQIARQHQASCDDIGMWAGQRQGNALEHAVDPEAQSLLAWMFQPVQPPPAQSAPDMLGPVGHASRLHAHMDLTGSGIQQGQGQGQQQDASGIQEHTSQGYEEHHQQQRQQHPQHHPQQRQQHPQHHQQQQDDQQTGQQPVQGSGGGWERACTHTNTKLPIGRQSMCTVNDKCTINDNTSSGLGWDMDDSQGVPDPFTMCSPREGVSNEGGRRAGCGWGQSLSDDGVVGGAVCLDGDQHQPEVQAVRSDYGQGGGQEGEQGGSQGGEQGWGRVAAKGHQQWKAAKESPWQQQQRQLITCGVACDEGEDGAMDDEQQQYEQQQQEEQQQQQQLLGHMGQHRQPSHKQWSVPSPDGRPASATMYPTITAAPPPSHVPVSQPFNTLRPSPHSFTIMTDSIHTSTDLTIDPNFHQTITKSSWHQPSHAPRTTAATTTSTDTTVQGNWTSINTNPNPNTNTSSNKPIIPWHTPIVPRQAFTAPTFKPLLLNKTSTTSTTSTTPVATDLLSTLTFPAVTLSGPSYVDGGGGGSTSAPTPTPTHTSAPTPAPSRRAIIPICSPEPAMHMRALQGALVEEVNLRVSEAAQPLVNQMQQAVMAATTAAAAGHAGGGMAPQQQLHGCVWGGMLGGQFGGCVGTGVGHGAGRGGVGGVGVRAGVGAGVAAGMGKGLNIGVVGRLVVEACARVHVPYFAGAQFKVQTPWEGKGEGRGRGGWRGKGRGGRGGRKGGAGGGKGADDDDDDHDDSDHRQAHSGNSDSSVNGGGSGSVKKHYLTIPDVRSRMKEFRKFDLWFLSSHPLMRPTPFPGPLPPLLIAVRSLWHGPDRDGKMEVELLTGNVPNLAKQQALYAWRGPDVSSELHVIQELAAAASSTGNHSDTAVPTSTTTRRKPALMPHLVRPQPPTYTLWDACSQAATGSGGGAVRSGPMYKKPRAHAGLLAGDGCDDDDEADGVGRDDRVGDAVEVVGGQSPRQVVAQLVCDIVSEFGLNRDQESVMRHVASWLLRKVAGGGEQDDEGASKEGGGISLAVQSPVCLVHGPFGSGKSTLLAALIMMLVAARDILSKDPKVDGRSIAKKSAAKTKAQKPPGSNDPAAALAAHCRVLVAANTNVAVDRVLMALEERGFTSFLRVGSLPRINRAVLPRSIHAADDSKEAVTQINNMIRMEQDELEKKRLMCELEALKAGADRQRRKALATTPVVGTTCAALLQSDLWQQAGEFPIVVLDESSQMTEPASMVPLLKAKASFLIAAGDPMQLPPVLANPAHVTPTNHQPHQPPTLGHLRHDRQQAEVDSTNTYGLLRPLFVRLQHMGHSAHLLRMQYRCHPSISMLPNRLYYDGQLVDGCSAAARGPAVWLAGGAGPGLPGGYAGEGGGGNGGWAGRQGKGGVAGRRDAIELGDGDDERGEEGVEAVESTGVGLPALCFCNVRDGDAQLDMRTRSSFNWAEARYIGDLVAALQRSGVSPDDVGVICFYKAQVDKISSAIAQQQRGGGAEQGQRHAVGPTRPGEEPGLGGDGGEDAQEGEHGGGGDGEPVSVSGVKGSKGVSKVVQVATVDSYQGAEKEIIILATTITRVNQAAFVSDPNRLNVALTRARRHLLVVGCARVLSSLPDTRAYANIITLCKQASLSQPHPQLSPPLWSPAVLAGGGTGADGTDRGSNGDDEQYGTGTGIHADAVAGVPGTGGPWSLSTPFLRGVRSPGVILTHTGGMRGNGGGVAGGGVGCGGGGGVSAGFYQSPAVLLGLLGRQ